MGADQSLTYTEIRCDGFVLYVSSDEVGCSTCTDDLKLKVKGESDCDSYKVCFYPNGFNQRVKDYASLWLQNLSTKERLITFTCAVLNRDGKQALKKSTKQRLGIESFMGWMTFCPRNILSEKDSKVLKEGNLILKFSIEIFPEKAFVNPEIEDEAGDNSLNNLSHNFMFLLSGKYFADFTMHVQGQIILVHKAILSARSPVLKTMLQSKLNNRNSMVITDISLLCVQEMLNFIYSGKVGCLNFQDASELYYAADKYEIIYLRNICKNILKVHLKVDNVLSALVLSERHCDVELQEICIQFVVKNASQVQELKEWMDFLKSHPKLVNIILRRLVKK